MKKKLTVLVLTLALLMSACGMEPGETKTVSGGSTAATSEKETKTAQTTSAAPTLPTVEEQLVYEWEGIKITLKSYVRDSIWGDGLKMLVENDTDKNIAVSSNDIIVNDYMVSDTFYCSVAAGKKANETLHFSPSNLERLGIDTVGRVEIYFHIVDTDSYKTLHSDGKFTVETSAAATMTVPDNSEGKEIYNAGGLRIVAKYADLDTLWGAGVYFYLENNTDRNVTFSGDDISVNGFMVDGLFSQTVYSGKKAVDDMTLYSSDLKDNNITEIKDVELTMRIYDADSWETIAKTEALKFSFE